LQYFVQTEEKLSTDGGKIEDSQAMEAVSVDGAYDTKECHNAIKE
jgi:hypothetical protein